MTTDNVIHHPNTDATDIFGFWLYILSDCILFSALFATFAVLHTAIYSGPDLKSIIDINYVFVETMVLLTSSFTYGLGILSLYKNHFKQLIIWLSITFLLGCTFVGMEVHEFYNLILEGHSFQNSAALSAFFTLVGTHGLHVTAGLIWMLVMIIQLLVFGSSNVMKKRLNYLALFWTFLDIVWIFVFTIVYLMGVI